MAKYSPKMRRGIGLGVIVIILGLAATLVLNALEDSVVYFYGPSDLAGKPLDNRLIRIGGLVVSGSIGRTVNGIITFQLTDGDHVIDIAYDGVLPDLFREGQGIIAEGRYGGIKFTADTILAKHDEAYMPKEVADILKEKGVWQEQPQ